HHPEPPGDRRLMRRAPIDDRRALDQLHHEIRAVVLRDAAVEQARNARVREPRADLALAAESPERGLAVDADRQELQRHLLIEAAVDALGEENRAHPALAD